jgi:hypothetical protein
VRPGLPLPPAGAGSTLIPTRRLILKDRNTPPADPERRKITFRAVTTSAAPANRVVPPAANGPSDPTVVGGYLAVYNGSGLTTDHVVFPLVSGNWSRPGPGRYRYTGNEFTAIKRIDLKADKITIKGKSSLWTYTLDEPEQG